MDLLLNWLYPPRCVFCNNIIPIDKYNKFDVCSNCIEKIPFIKEPTCYKCGKNISQIKELCNDCSKTEHIYTKGWIALEYNDMTKEAIHRFKYNNFPRYSKTFAEIMYKAMKDKNILDYKFDLIVSVPIHKNRFNKRGYNQSELLAKELSSKLNVPYKSLIKRIKDTKAQSSLSPKERYNNLKEAFEIDIKEAFKINNTNKNILIVDDIYTTGSTINACANRLIDIGINNIIYYYTLAGTSN